MRRICAIKKATLLSEDGLCMDECDLIRREQRGLDVDPHGSILGHAFHTFAFVHSLFLPRHKPASSGIDYGACFRTQHHAEMFLHAGRAHVRAFKSGVSRHDLIADSHERR